MKNEILSAMASDMNIVKYKNETDEQYVQRVLYSALACWIKAAALDYRIAQHNTMYSGASKKHIYEKSTSMLQSMLNRCPEITPWFYANKDTEDPIHIVRRRLIRNGDLQYIGFENTLTISPRSMHSICTQAEQINGIFFESNAFYSGVSSLRLTPYYKTENAESNITEWFNDYCVNAWWEDGAIHNDTAEYFDCNTNSRNIHSCWKKSPSQFQKHIRMVRIVINRNMFEYYLEKEYHNTILHHKIDPFLVELKEHRKMMLALRKDANTPIPACIKIFEDHSTLNLWVHLPYDMMEYLESYTWPSRNITDVLEWKYPLCLVNEIKNKLDKLGINVTEEKYG